MFNKLTAFLLIMISHGAVAQHTVIFIPGLYGSQLQEADSGDIRWADAGSIVF
ncbi:MAG: hypothetical protein HRT35_04325, partial [Algicola sp.]|nr:hypothetical protein [Algicola sp.]